MPVKFCSMSFLLCDAETSRRTRLSSRPNVTSKPGAGIRIDGLAPPVAWNRPGHPPPDPRLTRSPGQVPLLDPRAAHVEGDVSVLHFHEHKTDRARAIAR